MPFSATVADLPLPVALERSFRARATGTLTLEARQGKHVVFLRDGYPVAVELPGSFELLGKVLVEMKILTEDAYQKTTAEPLPAGMRYGELLLSRGLVTEDQLRQALKAQVRRKLHRLYFLTDASIAFTPGEHGEGLQRNESLRVHPWRANYHGVRSAWNADRLRQALVSLAGKPLHTALTPEELARFGLGAEDGKVGALLRGGPHTLDTLSLDSGLPPQPVSALVYSLLIAAALDDGGASTAALPRAASPPSTSSTLTGRPALQPDPPAAPPSISPAAQQHQQLIAERLRTIETDDLFAVLGVSRGAGNDQIKAAYLEAARRFHPDRLAAMNLSHLRADVQKIFSRVSEAQATLLDDSRRASYLASLERPAADVDASQQAVAILQAELAFKRGQHLLKKNDLAGALRDFEAAHATNPDEGEHVVYLAWTRHCLGRLSTADTKAELARGLKLQPKCASGYYFNGMLLKEEGQDGQAIAAFRKAVEFDARQFEAEQEIRVLETRRSKQSEKRGLFDRFRKPGK
jgi:curved DNA-binding protein CbpA